MTATDIPSTEFDTSSGFGDDAAPAPAPVAAKPAAAPAAPTADPKAAETKAPAKPGDGSLLGAPAPVYDLKAEGMHADDLKLYVDLLGEHKVDGKVGQAILDKMRPAFKARADADLAAAQTQWLAENAKDAAAAPRVEAALSVVSPETREALRGEVYVNHPALYRFVAEIGAFVQKATKQDTVVAGASPSTAPKFDPANTSSAAFAGGITSGF